ncbi:MAG: alpha/beta fold hydrolase, partial [Verrucomicrobiota bacterium]
DNTRRPNDLVVDRSGGIFFTLTKAGEVVYLSPDGTAKTVATGVETANGLILSPDESILYVAEFLPKRIVAFDVGEAGALSHRRVFATLDDGKPDLRGADGMTIDRAGNVYCAGPESMWVWAPDGTLLDQIPVEGKPINATFGGQQLRDLYITGFGGLHLQKMLVSGVSPQPADSSQPAHQDRPSVAIPEGVTPRLDVTYATYGTRDMLADLYVPPGEGPHPAVVIIHGGGWLNGDKTKFRAMGLDLAKRGFTTMAMAYRLGDEAPFPAAIHDCHAAVRFLRANAADYHVDPERIAAVGGSAGGHLAGLLATSADVAELQGDGGNAGVSSAIQCAVVMSGPMRIASGSVAERSLDPKVKKSNAKTFFRGTVDEKRDLYLLADAYEQIDAKTPPILFQYGGKEDPTKTAPSSEKLMELGIPTKTLSDYPDGKHGCWNRHPWFTPMLDDIEEWLREHL